MATVMYSGTRRIARGECVVFDDALYVFKTTESCRIGIDGNPLVFVGANESFQISSGAKYIFDRDTTVLVGFPPDDEDRAYLSSGMDLGSFRSLNKNVWYEYAIITPHKPMRLNLFATANMAAENDTTTMKLRIVHNGTELVQVSDRGSQYVSRTLSAYYLSLDATTGDSIEASVLVTVSGGGVRSVDLRAEEQR